MYTATSMLGKARSNAIYGPIRDKTKGYYRNVYLNSEHWKNLRREKLEKNPKCERCGSYLSLDVHHKEYHQLYDVLVKDLETLCRLCHNKEHKKKQNKKEKDRLKDIRRQERKLHKRNQKTLSLRYYKENRPSKMLNLIKMFPVYKKMHIYIFKWYLKQIINRCRDDHKLLEELKRERNFNTYISIHY